ncbi:MAG TPA: tail fiber domain-containing protein [Candidatus Binatia bacterium]|jgi:hypothetical protein|nr:tail fiber domain-containing protein [Candidatus Binatia bacterium]
MNKYLVQILLVACVAASTRANSSLTVGDVTLIIPGGPCWDDSLLVPAPLTTSNSFTLTGVSGIGVVTSVASYKADNVRLEDHVFYVYSLDLSGMSVAANHCVKLLIHFSRPLSCTYDVLVLTNGTGTVNVSSGTLTPLGDVTFLFGAGCLSPGKTATTFGMLSDTQPKNGTLTIIDDWTDGNNQAHETLVNVPAIVPDMPPDWAYPVQLPYSVPVPFPSFQGNISCNSIPMLPPSNGLYNFTFQLLDGSNGLPVSLLVTQAVKVVNGLFTTPLPFNPTIFMGNPLWLSMSVMPPNGNSFTPLTPPLPITPTPQALYAYSAGVVADLSPGQAVTSLNGLSDRVILAAGTGVTIGTNGNTLIISSSLGSDRNIKTGFLGVNPEDILARLVALPIQSWRFTNEVPNIRHLGPTAQDFKATFGLGASDTTIGIVDEGGVALTAIQGLNQKLEAQVKTKDAEIEALRLRLEKLERTAGQRNLDH